MSKASAGDIQRARAVAARLVERYGEEFRPALDAMEKVVDEMAAHRSRGRRAAIIPPGSWPRRMPAAYAAGYCGESTVDAFLSRIGTEYPQPRVSDGRRKLWLRDDLDRAIGASLDLDAIDAADVM